MKTEATERKCWNPKCRRIIIGDGKFGLCDTCFNKYGTLAVSVSVPAVAGTIWKNKGKIANGAINVIKHIKH